MVYQRCHHRHHPTMVRNSPTRGNLRRHGCRSHYPHRSLFWHRHPNKRRFQQLSLDNHYLSCWRACIGKSRFLLGLVAHYCGTHHAVGGRDELIWRSGGFRGPNSGDCNVHQSYCRRAYYPPLGPSGWGRDEGASSKSSSHG